MELRLLEDFICLSEVRNFSRAAEIRHVAQSTLSKRIRSLEHWVGVPLVDRSSYPVRLTDEGRMMIQRARDLVQQINNLRSCVRSLSEQTKDQISILAMHTLRVTYIPQWADAIRDLIGEFDETPMPSYSAYSTTVRLFRNDDCDFLITYVHPAVTLGLDTTEIESLTLGSEMVVPVSAPDADGNALHDLDRNPVVRYLAYDEQSFFARVLAPILHEKLFAVNVVATNAMSVGLHSLALVGSGVAWLPESIARDDLRTGRLVLAGGPDWSVQTTIAIYRKKANHRPIVDKIWDAAQQLQRAPLDRASGGAG